MTAALPNLMVFDYTAKRPAGEFEDVARFAEAKIGDANLGKTVYLTLGWHRRKNFLSTTLVSSKKDASNAWLHVKVRVQRTAQYPQKIDINVATCAVEDKVAQILMGQRFTYESESIEFADDQEAVVFGVGNGLFWALRKLKKVGGRLAKTTRNIHGKEWLEQFRRWRASGKNIADVEPEQFVEKKRREVARAE